MDYSHIILAERQGRLHTLEDKNAFQKELSQINSEIATIEADITKENLDSGERISCEDVQWQLQQRAGNLLAKKKRLQELLSHVFVSKEEIEHAHETVKVNAERLNSLTDKTYR